MAHRSFQHRTAADTRTRRLLMKKAQEIDPTVYVARLRQAYSTNSSRTESQRKTETPSPHQCGRWTPSRRRESPVSPYLRNNEDPMARRPSMLPYRRDLRQRLIKAMELMEQAVTDDGPRADDKSQTIQDDVGKDGSDTERDPENE